MLEDKGEGMNENGGRRLKLTGGPTFGLPPVPTCVMAIRRDAVYVSSSAIITRHCGLSWELGVVPPMQSTIKTTRARKNRRAILVPGILRSSQKRVQELQGSP